MTARTATVQNITEHPGTGKPLTNGQASIRLNTPAFTIDGTREKLRTRYVSADDAGMWSVLLEINDDLDPAGTSYTVREASGVVWTFQLTAAMAGQTVNLRDCLVVDPANPNPLVAGVSEAELTAQLGNYPQVLADPTAVAAYAAGLTPGTVYTVIQTNPFDVLQGVA